MKKIDGPSLYPGLICCIWAALALLGFQYSGESTQHGFTWWIGAGSVYLAVAVIFYSLGRSLMVLQVRRGRISRDYGLGVMTAVCGMLFAGRVYLISSSEIEARLIAKGRTDPGDVLLSPELTKQSHKGLAQANRLVLEYRKYLQKNGDPNGDLGQSDLDLTIKLGDHLYERGEFDKIKKYPDFEQQYLLAKQGVR